MVLFVGSEDFNPFSVFQQTVNMRVLYVIYEKRLKRVRIIYVLYMLYCVCVLRTVNSPFTKRQCTNQPNGKVKINEEKRQKKTERTNREILYMREIYDNNPPLFSTIAHTARFTLSIM